MAAPSFVAASTGSTDATGPWSATCHAPGAAGRIIILQVLQDGATAGAVTFTSATNIEDLAGVDNQMTQISGPGTNGAWAVGGSSEAFQYIWVGRSLSTTAPTFTGGNSTSEDTYWRFYEFQNVSTGTTLATVIEPAVASIVNSTGTSNTASDSAVTTLGPDRLALNFVAVNDDNAISAFTGETGGSWALATDPYAESSGTDGAIALQVGFPGGSYQPRSNAENAFGQVTVPYLAESFVAQGNCTQVRAQLAKVGSPSDSAQIEIRTDSSGSPSSTVLGSGTVSNALLTTTPTWMDVDVSATLSAGTTYWVVFTRTSTTSNSNYYTDSGSITDFWAGGVRKNYSSGAWQAIGGDLAFGVLNRGATSGTIDGGTGSIVDSDAWGVVGFALIGTTVAGPTYQPRDAETFHDFR